MAFFRIFSCLLQRNLVKNFIFQQDNDRKNTSKLIKSYLEENNINFITLPAMSPDVNPNENCCDIIKSKVAELQPKNKVQLKEAMITTRKEQLQKLQ